MNARTLPGLAVVVILGCGVVEEPAGLGGPRAGVAQAAIHIQPNPVSCNSQARRAFAAALCVCEDAVLVGSGLTVMCSEGRSVDVGVNGLTRVVGDYQINGTLVSWKGVDDVGELNVAGDLMTPADVSGVGTLTVGRDLIVGGKLSTVGDLSVGGRVRAAGPVSHVGSTSVATGPYIPRDAPPCACDPAGLIDVCAEVARARTANDNVALGISEVNSVGELELVLNGGRYYLADVSSVGRLRIHVRAPSALYIQGALRTVGTDTIDVDPNASLDLFVAGGVENVGEWQVGTGTRAGAVRLFVGGHEPVLTSVGSKDFVGSIYAPTADVTLVGDVRIRGALFAKNLSGTGRLLIDYAEPALPAAEDCPPP